ncbi:hypothetical protein OK348_06360 [Flavobacterium sp. MXW15]|uniref:Extracellular membrane protein CFEM domain-containing protein n=1 Tax=Xanthomonas chitinilytica TaxID=2989819 RepID=A0ABT3JT52_9XANT|nr:hypothetical protein [Xanthomonas sp. H13-6]MCW4454414.1 hypothetical protein [Flavobacterium sp. MXW15]MCW4471654.1 hypothetical protein [Xanthomonas sp. H13-6]
MKQGIKHLVAIAVFASSMLVSSVVAAPPCDLKCFQIYNACKTSGGSDAYCMERFDECMQTTCNAPFD